MNKEQIINYCLERNKGSNYLEIGVRSGRSITPIVAKRKWGVDPEIRLSGHPLKNYLKKKKAFLFGTRFFNMTSDKFFETHKSLLKKHEIHVAFVDGLHTYEQSLRDVDNCLKYLSDDGFIVMHDCCPTTSSSAFPAKSLADARKMNLPGWTGDWCGDVWKTIVNLRLSRSNLAVVVLDCDLGVGVIKKGKRESMPTLTLGDLEGMGYDDLALKKKELLNLKDPDFIHEFINVS